MEIRPIPRESRAIEMSVPIKVAANLATPSGLLYTLTHEENVVVLTSRGELLTSRFSLPDGRNMEGMKTVNYNLIIDAIVAQQLARQEAGYLFPAPKETDLPRPTGALIGLMENRADQKFTVREVQTKTLIDALRSCIPNIDTTYMGYGDPEVAKNNWGRMLTQLDCIAERLGKAMLIKNYSDRLAIVAELDGGQNYNKGVSFFGVKFDTGSLGLSDGDYPLHLDFRMDINPGWVANHENRMGNFLTATEIETVEDFARAQAKKLAPEERQTVSVNYDAEVEAFVIRRDNYTSEQARERAPANDVIQHIEIIRDYVCKAIKVGWQDYIAERTQRQQERSTSLARLEAAVSSL
jgi:hypothetical protein